MNAVVPKAARRGAPLGRRDAREIAHGAEIKHSFNADSEAIAGIGTLAFDSLDLFLETAEAREGVTAFNEKRLPDFGKYRR